ncbi:MAG TPA: gamma-glutamylcyclotransferase [Pyrinomonadaceae bacterium]|nr:gamma-glutamylcyclotransferase [Pyrinomonadaceae bacterium]
MNKHLVFVYGTLRRGSARAMSVRFPGSKFIAKAKVSGGLYDLGAYPGLLLDESNLLVIGEKQLIEEVKTNVPDAGQTISYDAATAHVYGNAAVVNYILIVKGRDREGKDYANRYRITVVWVKQQGHWRMAAIHVSRIRP